MKGKLLSLALAIVALLFILGDQDLLGVQGKCNVYWNCFSGGGFCSGGGWVCSGGGETCTATGCFCGHMFCSCGHNGCYC